MAETSPAPVNVSAASGAGLTRRFGALVPGLLREPLASLRRDLHVVLEGLAGRHPSPLLPQRPRGPAASAGPAPRTLRIERVVRETADAVTLWLRDPSGAPIPFVAGQFFTVLVPLDGQLVRRAYSVCSSPLSPDTVAITCKRTPGGRVSSFLNEQAQAGMTLQVLGPSGNFTVAPEPERARHYVLLGGGSGITPLIAIARAVLLAEPRSRVSLIFGNRSVEDIIFRHELAALADAHKDRFSLRHVLQEPPSEWSGGVGLLDEPNLGRELSALALLGIDPGLSDPPAFFICGPAGMMAAAQSVLLARGVPAAALHQERFASPHLPAAALLAARRPQPAELRHGERRHQLVVQPTETLLEAGLRAGAAMPFSCTMGGCGACKVKLDSGQVALQEPNCLTAEERAAGYILACIAAPCTQVVVELP